MAIRPTIVPKPFEMKSVSERTKDLAKLQRWTIDCIHEAWDSGQLQVVAIRPTGFGKTFTVGSLLRERDKNNSYVYKNVTFLCPTNTIKAQVISELISEKREILDCIIEDTSMSNSVIKKLNNDERGKGKIYDNSHGKPDSECVHIRLVSYMFTARSELAKSDLDNPEVISAEQIKRIFSDKPDLVIMDEFHHTGASRTLTALSNAIVHESGISNVKVLGLTATYDRNDNVDAGDILFGGQCLIPEYSYTEAVKDGILPAVRYGCIDYGQWVAEDEKARQIIEAAGKAEEDIKANGGVETSQQKKLKLVAQRLKAQLDIRTIRNMANTLSVKVPEAIGKEAMEKTQKWLIYFPGIARLLQDRDVVTSWFREAFPGRDIRPITVIGKTEVGKARKRKDGEEADGESLDVSEQKLAREIAEDYKANLSKVVTKRAGKYNPSIENGAIVLIFSVGMLLEGAHIDNVTGCMLFTTTHRYNKFYQILGRVIDSQRKYLPIVIDMLSNYATLRIDLKKDLESKKKPTYHTGLSLGDIRGGWHKGNNINSEDRAILDSIKMVDVIMDTAEDADFINLIEGIDHSRALARIASQVCCDPRAFVGAANHLGIPGAHLLKVMKKQHDERAVTRSIQVEADSEPTNVGDECIVEDTGMINPVTHKKYYRIVQRKSGFMTPEELKAAELAFSYEEELEEDIRNIGNKSTEQD